MDSSVLFCVQLAIMSNPDSVKKNRILDFFMLFRWKLIFFSFKIQQMRKSYSIHFDNSREINSVVTFEEETCHRGREIVFTKILY